MVTEDTKNTLSYHNRDSKWVNGELIPIKNGLNFKKDLKAGCANTTKKILNFPKNYQKITNTN